jgi:hypothetical protein
MRLYTCPCGMGVTRPAHLPDPPTCPGCGKPMAPPGPDSVRLEKLPDDCLPPAAVLDRLGVRIADEQPLEVVAEEPGTLQHWTCEDCGVGTVVPHGEGFATPRCPRCDLPMRPFAAAEEPLSCTPGGLAAMQARNLRADVQAEADRLDGWAAVLERESAAAEKEAGLLKSKAATARNRAKGLRCWLACEDVPF